MNSYTNGAAAVPLANEELEFGEFTEQMTAAVRSAAATL